MEAIESLRADITRLTAERDALRSEITEAAYRAWPEAEDVGYDAGSIIDQLAAERDSAQAGAKALRAFADTWNADAQGTWSSAGVAYHIRAEADRLEGDTK